MENYPGAEGSIAQRCGGFLLHLERVKGYSLQTIRAYATDLRQWITFLARSHSILDIDDLSRVDRHVLRHYGAWLRGRGLAARTVCRKNAAVRSFLRFLAGRDELFVEMADLLQNPKAGRRLPRFLTEDEMASLLDSLEVLLNAIGIEDGTAHATTGTYDVIVVAAYLNWLTVTEDRSKGIHNPPYIERILKNSIEMVEPFAP